jgi:hypothetical protein
MAWYDSPTCGKLKRDIYKFGWICDQGLEVPSDNDGATSPEADASV